MASLDQPIAKGPLSDILRYFPTVAATLGNKPTDESALIDLAVWLSHWQERNGKFAEVQYSLPGQIEQQQRAAPDEGKFLKACIRLHEALTPRLAAEQPAKNLLGSRFNADKWQAIREAVTWWAGWIKKQGHSPVRQYLDALKTIPVFQNTLHQWDLDARVCDDSISRELAPLQREFKHVYRELPTEQQQGLLRELRIIADFDTERIKRYREDYEQNRYALELLVSNVDEFVFPVWDRIQTVFNQVSPMFWSWLRACIAIRRGEARALLVALGATLTNLAPTAVPDADATPDRLTGDELALLCVYAGHCITDANAKEYLEGKLKSGRALYNKFTHYSSQSNRTGFADETAQVRKNMIARIQKVLPRLNDEQKKRAENDIHTLTAQN